jgi:hypothetical protein
MKIKRWRQKTFDRKNGRPKLRKHSSQKAFGNSLCTYESCWKWCPRTSIQAWTRLILFANNFSRSACEMFLMNAVIAVFNSLSVRGRSRYTPLRWGTGVSGNFLPNYSCTKSVYLLPFRKMYSTRKTGSSIERTIVSKNWLKQLHILPVLHFNRCLTTEYSETTAHFNGNFDTDNQIYLP